MKNWPNWLNELDAAFEKVCTKQLPQLSDKTREQIVKIVPWLILVLTIISIPSLLVVLGLTGPVFMLGGLVAGPRVALSGIISGVLLIITIGLQLLAIPRLLKKKRAGWNLLFYGELIYLAQEILSLSLIGVLVAGLGFYLLYQIKGYYN